MAKLNREITEAMFKCTTSDEVKAIIDSGANLEEVSRMALDEALSKVFKKKCTGVKTHAIEMLVGAVNDVDVPDISVTPNLNQPTPPVIPSIDPVERFERLKNRAKELVMSAKDNFIRATMVRRDAEMKMLGVTDEDLKAISKENTDVVCGADSSGKLYLMKRDQATMDDLSTKWGDTYFN